jgi:3-isopropylmalate/(R)-2-methylmalate dehydratase small subunit
MEPIAVLRGTGAPLRRTSVDTDQIAPSRFLKRITRHGYEDAAFAAWRDDPDFVLNDPRFAAATVLVAGQDFGTGSSREIAVWALQDYGFRAVIAPRFGDIFRTNAGKSGLVAVVLEHERVEHLWDLLDADPALEITIDLEALEVSAGTERWSFDLDPDTRYRLLNGLDEIALSLESEAEIAAFEASRPAYRPRIPLD